MEQQVGLTTVTLIALVVTAAFRFAKYVLDKRTNGSIICPLLVAKKKLTKDASVSEDVSDPLGCMLASLNELTRRLDRLEAKLDK